MVLPKSDSSAGMCSRSYIDDDNYSVGMWPPPKENPENGDYYDVYMQRSASFSSSLQCAGKD